MKTEDVAGIRAVYEDLKKRLSDLNNEHDKDSSNLSVSKTKK